MPQGPVRRYRTGEGRRETGEGHKTEVNAVIDTPHKDALRRVVIIGTSGAGKTTLARCLAARLGLPHIEFDAYRHGSNWTPTPNRVLRQNVAKDIAADGWITDGNYTVVRDIVWTRATAIIWLDYPFPIVFWRLFWRTMGRCVKRTELWNGNREKLWWHFFTKDSLFLWAFQTHWSRKKGLIAAFGQPQHRHLTVFRLRSPRETRRLLASLLRATLPKGGQ